MKNEFESKLDEIKKKYGDELNVTRNEMVAKLKKDYGMFVSYDKGIDCIRHLLNSIVILVYLMQRRGMKSSSRIKRKNNRTCNECINENWSTPM